MSLLSLFTVAVFASEIVLSPIPDVTPTPFIQHPSVSFGQLANSIPAATPSAETVLGASSEHSVSTSPTPTPTQRLPTRAARKSHYTIAVLGDSMADTLGPDIPHLKKKLQSMYPSTTFTMLNYGVGGTNIDYGFERLSNDYTYLGRNYPSLFSQKPDIIIVESFGYNPYSYDTGAIDAHWLKLAAIVSAIKINLPGTRIVIAATIAPNSKTFGDGAAGLAFSPQDKQERTAVIKRYLDSTVKFARSEHLPLADLYHATLDGNGDGKLGFINGGDHIHYSDAGRSLFAQKVMEAIVNAHILQ